MLESLLIWQLCFLNKPLYFINKIYFHTHLEWGGGIVPPPPWRRPCLDSRRRTALTVGVFVRFPARCTHAALLLFIISSLSSFQETSQRIILYGNSFPPTFPEVLLAHASQMTGQLSRSMHISCKYWQAERQYKMRCTRQYVRIFSFALLNNLDLWFINYYSSQLRFAHQRAVSVWPLLCSVQVSMMFFLRWVHLSSISGGPGLWWWAHAE